MVTAIVLATVERGEVNRVAQQLVDLDGISEVYSVSGNFDLVGIIRVANNDLLARLVTERMTTINGVLTTHTMLAFQAFSRHDLESLFAIGLEEKTSRA